jgi:hypothetical protein
LPDIRAANGRDALCQVAARVMSGGHDVSPRGMRTREIEHLTVQIANPYDALCIGINANQSRKVAAAETLQLIGGFSDPTFAIEHAPALKAFVNDVGEFDGAYGPRLRTQYEHLVKRLYDDETTRQAVLSIWRPHDLMRQGSKDYPCTLVLGFAIRRGQLNLSVVMRSNDVNWGFKNDIFQFTQLQCSIANILGIEAGTYRHTAFSMHLYERDFEWALDLDHNAAFDQLKELPPAGIRAQSVEEMQRTATAIAYGEPTTYQYSHQWFANALGDAR